MTQYRLTPNDTLFFRDSRPFNEGEGGNLEATSSFPPSPRTTAGALKAALAREQGWTSGAWDASLKVLDTDVVSYRGPYLESRGELWYAMPSALLLELDQPGKLVNLVRMAPAIKPTISERGALRLCEANRKPLEHHLYKDSDEYWVSTAGFEAFLSGGVPTRAQVCKSNDLWQSETRIGIYRDQQARQKNTARTRTTGDNALYQIAHTRVRDGVNLVVSVVGTGWTPQTTGGLGGESRMIGIIACEALIPLPAAPILSARAGRIDYTVTLLTPVPMLEDKVSGWNGGSSVKGLPGELVGASISKPSWVGGWDSEAKAPLPATPMIPSGSVFFLSAPEDQLEDIQKLHLSVLASGNDKNLGFGQIVIGHWEQP